MEQCFVPTNSKLRVWGKAEFKEKGVFLNHGETIVDPEIKLLPKLIQEMLPKKLKFYLAFRCCQCQVLQIDYGEGMNSTEAKSVYRE